MIAKQTGDEGSWPTTECLEQTVQMYAIHVINVKSYSSMVLHLQRTLEKDQIIKNPFSVKYIYVMKINLTQS